MGAQSMVDHHITARLTEHLGMVANGESCRMIGPAGQDQGSMLTEADLSIRSWRSVSRASGRTCTSRSPGNDLGIGGNAVPSRRLNGVKVSPRMMASALACRAL